MTASPDAAARFVPDPSAASAPFWAAAAQHRLTIQRCDGCGLLIHWPRLICPGCLSYDLLEWPVSGKATLLSFTIVHQRYHPGFEPPYNIAVVELDDAPGIRMLTNVAGCANEDLAVGMPVEVTFEVRGEMAVPQFQPVRPASPA